MILTADVGASARSEGSGKVTVSWSIVFVLPTDEREDSPSRRFYVEKTKRCISLERESFAAIVRWLPQRESRTTCNLGINSFLSRSLCLRTMCRQETAAQRESKQGQV